MRGNQSKAAFAAIPLEQVPDWIRIAYKIVITFSASYFVFTLIAYHWHNKEAYFYQGFSCGWVIFYSTFIICLYAVLAEKNLEKRNGSES